MRIGSLFTGYGGLDMAASDVFGADVAWHCESDPDASRILAHAWPHVPNLGDISLADFTRAAPVQVTTGGFPCQDISLAGPRTGLAAGTRSGLWSHMLRAVETLQPQWVVIENVPGILSSAADSHMESCSWCLGDGDDQPSLRALGAVLGDLADCGFDAEWICVPASDVGAPHRRRRVFILAWPRHALPHPPGERRREGIPTPTRPPRRHDAGPGHPPPNRWNGDWQSYTATVHHWEAITGHPAPCPVDDHGRLSPAFGEWMMGLPPGHVSAVPGLSRSRRLKAIGNGVVPRQAAAALRLLLARAYA